MRCERALAKRCIEDWGGVGVGCGGRGAKYPYVFRSTTIRRLQMENLFKFLASGDSSVAVLL